MMVLKSFLQIQDYIDSLPEVAEGYVRLFRGQTNHYDKILSSAHRGKEIEGRAQWDQYCTLLVHEMAMEEEDHIDSIEVLLYWVQVLSQHYGPGSEFLDVTKSVKVAIWFALNKCERITKQLLSGEGKEPDPNDVITINEYLSYAPAETNGFIYVLDVPEPANTSLLERTTAINLSKELSSTFDSALRIKAQEASLVRCDPNLNNGDVSNFLVGNPIPIAPSCLTDIGDQYTVAHLFPSPEIDLWYDRFCKVPYSICGFTETGQMAAKRSIPVEFYVTDYESFKTINQRVVTCNPFNYYLQNPLVHPKDRAEYDEALPILLDNPVLFTSRQNSMLDWNNSLLWKHAELATVSNQKELLNTPLYCTGNDFYEFSPLETAEWKTIVDKTGDVLNLRALWLRNYNNRLFKAEFYLDHYDKHLSTKNWQDSFKKVNFEFYFDEEKGFIAFNTPEKKPIASEPLIANAIFTVLTIMGDCRPEISIKPIPAAIIEHTETKAYTYHVIATEQTMTLTRRLSKPNSGVNFYGVYHNETKETYHSVGAHLKKCASITIESSLPFCFVSQEDIIQLFIDKYGDFW